MSADLPDAGNVNLCLILNISYIKTTDPNLALRKQNHLKVVRVVQLSRLSTTKTHQHPGCIRNRLETCLKSPLIIGFIKELTADDKHNWTVRQTSQD